MGFLFKWSCLCGIIIFVSTGALAATYYVPADCSTIQEAINAATSGDIIIVSLGTYYENINFGGKDVILTSTDPSDPSTVSATIIDGGGNGTVVTFDSTESSACELNGFTITNGDTYNGDGSIYNGGGICGGWEDVAIIWSTRATISNCVITGNAADYGGGVWACQGTISNCVISGNTADWGGGLQKCPGTINNCTIADNTAGLAGGGLHWCDGTIINCSITGNTSLGGAGGVFSCEVLINCTIAGNTAVSGGGLALCDETITNCIIWGNSASDSDDQLFMCSTPTYSCIQDWTGGGTDNITSDPLFANAENENYHVKSQYGRWDPNTSEWLYDTETSPCIDAGDPTDMAWQNELWPHGGRINMGAYGGTPQASMSPNPTGNIANLDHDDAVGISDFMLFCKDYLFEQHLLDTDLNRNGKVDITDYALFTQQWLWVEP